jgi:hypothetical protein
MKTVVFLPGVAGQPDAVLGLEEDVDDSDMRKAAMEAFNEMVHGGCSLEDAITAVYTAGMDKVTGATSKRRKRPSVPPCPYEAIVNLYETHLDMLPKVGVITTERKKAMREMWTWVLKSHRRDNTRRAETAEQAIAWFKTYFETAALNDFICGRTPRSRGHENWKADLGYLLSKRGMLNVIEKTHPE